MVEIGFLSKANDVTFKLRLATNEFLLGFLNVCKPVYTHLPCIPVVTLSTSDGSN